MAVAYPELERRIKRSVNFEPCLPRSAKKPPSSPGWLHEIKHDGFRIVAQKEADNVRSLPATGVISPIAIR
jgi:ATP-dependent DNA ligase